MSFTWVLVWRAQDSFTYMIGTFVGTAGKIGPLPFQEVSGPLHTVCSVGKMK